MSFGGIFSNSSWDFIVGFESPYLTDDLSFIPWQLKSSIEKRQNFELDTNLSENTWDPVMLSYYAQISNNFFLIGD